MCCCLEGDHTERGSVERAGILLPVTEVRAGQCELRYKRGRLAEGRTIDELGVILKQPRSREERHESEHCHQHGKVNSM